MPVPTINSASAANGTLGQVFAYQVAATNAPTGYMAKYLPAGLGINYATGLVEGCPETPGNFLVRLTASNASGTSAEFTLTIIVTGDTTDPIPADVGSLLKPTTSNIYSNYGGGSNGGASSQSFVQQADVSVTMTSTAIVPVATTARRVTVTHPGGNNTVFLATGKPAVLNSGVALFPGGSWTSDPTTQSINGITSTGTETVTPFY
jgi:hypothetical protein